MTDADTNHAGDKVLRVIGIDKLCSAHSSSISISSEQELDLVFAIYTHHHPNLT